jgi:hypothetical protein
MRLLHLRPRQKKTLKTSSQQSLCYSASQLARNDRDDKNRRSNYSRRCNDILLDSRPYFSYASHFESRSPKGAFRMRSRCGASAVPARGLANRSRAALGHRSAGMMTGLRGAR